MLRESYLQVVRVRRVASMLRGCYEITASVEFRLYSTTQFK